MPSSQQLQSLKEDSTETLTELAQLVSAVNTSRNDVMYHKTKKTRVSAAVQLAFKRNWPLLVDKLKECVADRLESVDAMKNVGLLNFSSWPIAAFDTFGNSEVSLFVNHFKPLLKKNEVSLSAVATEWNTFKHYAAHSIQDNLDIWSILLTSYRSKFPNFVHLDRNTSAISSQQCYSSVVSVQ